MNAITVYESASCWVEGIGECQEYCIKGQEWEPGGRFYVATEGELYRAQEGVQERTYQLIEGKELDSLWAAVEAAKELVAATQRERMELAHEQSKDNSDLANIIYWHLDFSNGKLSCHTHEGVTFYQVGRNSSHQFYAGVDDNGQIWKLITGESYDDEGEQETTMVKVYKDKGYGYMGHF